MSRGVLVLMLSTQACIGSACFACSNNGSDSQGGEPRTLYGAREEVEAGIFGDWLEGEAGFCNLPVSPDAPNILHLKPTSVGRQRKESNVRSLKRVAQRPATWVVEYAPVDGGRELERAIIVLAADRMVVVSGAETKRYRRCR